VSRAEWTRSIFSGGWPALNRTNKLSVPPSSVHGSHWSGASLEDDLAMAAMTTVSDTVQSGTGHISNNYQQPLQSRRKARRLTGPPDPAIPRPDSIGRVSPSKTLKPTLALQKYMGSWLSLLAFSVIFHGLRPTLCFRPWQARL
jgi:hypothetical protein